MEDPDAIAELELYGLSYRTINILDDHDYIWIRDLEQLDPEELLTWRNVAERTLEEITAALRNYHSGHQTKTVRECVEFSH